MDMNMNKKEDIGQILKEFFDQAPDDYFPSTGHEAEILQNVKQAISEGKLTPELLEEFKKTEGFKCWRDLKIKLIPKDLYEKYFGN